MSALEVRDEGRLRILTLNRPERKNALNGELIHGIPRAIREANADDDVWAIAITGAGQAFCSGLDLEMASAAPAERPKPGAPADADADADGNAEASGSGGDGAAPGDDVDDTHWALLMRVVCEKPVVAGINGVAVGAGVSLAMNADIRIAAPSARFHPGYARVGTSPDFGLTWTLLRAVGYERALRFLLDQRMILGREALELGMVSEVVERDEHLEDRLIEYGTKLASVAPRAARQTKRLLVALDQPGDLAAHLDTEIDLALRGLTSADGAEAIRAMLEGDTPKFTGR